MATMRSSGNLSLAAEPRLAVAGQPGAHLARWLNASHARLLAGLLFLFSGAAVAGCDPLVRALLAADESSGGDRWVQLALLLEHLLTVNSAHLLSLAVGLALMIVAVPVLVGPFEPGQEQESGRRA